MILLVVKEFAMASLRRAICLSHDSRKSLGDKTSN